MLSQARYSRWKELATGWIPRVNVDVPVKIFAVFVLLYLVGIPLTTTIITAFRGPADFLPFEAGAGFTLDNISAVYGSPRLFSVLWDTLLFAGGSVALAFVIGLTLAFLVERTDLPFGNTVFFLVIVPIMMPPLTLALAWILIMGEASGFLNVMIRGAFFLEGRGPLSIFTLYGMIIVQGLSLSGISFLLMSAALRNMDPSLEDASATSGGKFLATLRRVTLPVLRPHILSAVILMFILSAESLDVPLVLGQGAKREVLATEIYYGLNVPIGLPLYGEVAALAIHFLLMTYVLFFIYSRLTKHASRFATVTGKGFRPKRWALGRWKYPALGFVGVYTMFQLIMPVLLLVWTSLLGRFAAIDLADIGEFNLRAYRIVLADSRFLPAVRNTLIVAFGSATIITILSSTIAWLVVRGSFRGRRFLDLLASSSIATPSVIAGLTFLIFYLTISRWIPLYGTIWVLILAYSYRMTVAYRVNVAGLTQINRELEEASFASGGSWISTYRKVVIPLLAPSMMVGFVLIFFLGFRDFTLALLVGSADNTVLSVLVWNRLRTNDQFAEAAVLSLVSIAFLLTVSILLRGIVIRQIRESR